MNVEIGTETAQFPGKEYLNGVFVAVYLVLTMLVLSGCVRAICPSSREREGNACPQLQVM